MKERVMEPHKSCDTEADGTLPRWDLSDLYSGLDDTKIQEDLAWCLNAGKSFADQWQGTLSSASAGALLKALQAYEKIDQRMGRLASYAQLSFAAHTTDPAVASFQQTISEQLTDISSLLLFFLLEINKIDEKVLSQKLGEPVLNPWRSFFESVLLWRPYQLSDEVERVLVEKSVTGRASWVRLFDETMAATSVSLEGEERPLGDAFNKLTNADREIRKRAAEAIQQALQSKQSLLLLITNTLAKDKSIEDGLRQLPTSASSRHLSNRLEVEVVNALVTTVDSNLERLSHRYYTLKARWLRLDKLKHWDRNAPVPGGDDRSIIWDEAKSIVRTAYSNFDPRLGKLVGQFIDNAWIDVAPVPGKASGAFAHPVTPDVHPYILLNYRGRARDVMTLAHELGHGAHQLLAAKQGYLRSATPLTLAETASVFGEMLTFRALLDAEKDSKRKRHLLAGKVEDMLNTVVRQIAFYQFEESVHRERKKGELSAVRIGELWRETQSRSLGPAFDLTPDYDLYWSYIPHFVHSPFYVYAYAFGDCLVNALYDVYQKGAPNFQDLYLELLEAGGTKSHKELLAPFGLDASDPHFWQRGLNVISGFIDELEGPN